MAMSALIAIPPDSMHMSISSTCYLRGLLCLLLLLVSDSLWLLAGVGSLFLLVCSFFAGVRSLFRLVCFFCACLACCVCLFCWCLQVCAGLLVCDLCFCCFVSSLLVWAHCFCWFVPSLLAWLALLATAVGGCFFVLACWCGLFVSVVVFLLGLLGLLCLLLLLVSACLC